MAGHVAILVLHRAADSKNSFSVTDYSIGFVFDTGVQPSGIDRIVMALAPKFAGQKLAAGLSPKAIHTLELCESSHSANTAAFMLTLSDQTWIMCAQYVTKHSIWISISRTNTDMQLLSFRKSNSILSMTL